MRSRLKWWLGLPPAGLISIYLLLVIIGDGLGEKDPLPDRITRLTRPLLFVHRGVTGAFPENSMAAIEGTLQCGFQALEIDLQYSADSQFFLFHDYTTERLMGLNAVASEMTLAQLQQYPLRSEAGTSDERVPTLADVIARYGDNFVFYFDMKRHGHRSVIDLARDISGFIEKHDLYQKAIVASAHFGFITYLEWSNPRILTALEGIDPRAPWLFSLLPRKFRADFISSRHETATDDFLQWLEDTGMVQRYIAYHVDERRLHKKSSWDIQMFIMDFRQIADTLSDSDCFRTVTGIDSGGQ